MTLHVDNIKMLIRQKQWFMNHLKTLNAKLEASQAKVKGLQTHYNQLVSVIRSPDMQLLKFHLNNYRDKLMTEKQEQMRIMVAKKVDAFNEYKENHPIIDRYTELCTELGAAENKSDILKMKLETLNAQLRQKQINNWARFQTMIIKFAIDASDHHKSIAQIKQWQQDKAEITVRRDNAKFKYNLLMEKSAQIEAKKAVQPKFVVVEDDSDLSDYEPETTDVPTIDFETFMQLPATPVVQIKKVQPKNVLRVGKTADKSNVKRWTSLTQSEGRNKTGSLQRSISQKTISTKLNLPPRLSLPIFAEKVSSPKPKTSAPKVKPIPVPATPTIAPPEVVEDDQSAVEQPIEENNQEEQQTEEYQPMEEENQEDEPMEEENQEEPANLLEGNADFNLNDSLLKDLDASLGGLSNLDANRSTEDLNRSLSFMDIDGNQSPKNDSGGDFFMAQQRGNSESLDLFAGANTENVHGDNQGDDFFGGPGSSNSTNNFDDFFA